MSKKKKNKIKLQIAKINYDYIKKLKNILQIEPKSKFILLYYIKQIYTIFKNTLLN